MGSFLWDEECNNMCYSHYHNGRPLSVVLTEPCDPFEPQRLSFFDDIPCIESDFASLNHLQHHHHHHHHHQQQQQQQQQHHRSRSSGRRYKRECYSVHYPNANFNSYCFSPPPPPRRALNRCASREILVEKIETVTIEEAKRRPPPPPPCMVSCVRTPSPTIRQVKIRPRPSSCFDLHKESTDIQHQQRQNRWSKYVDEHHEEHFEYNYNYNKVPERIVPIQREQPAPPPPSPPPPLPRIIRHDATTSTHDLYIPRPPTPKPVRPETRDAGTTTAGLPKKPLCVTETQVIERFEKTEKVRCDSASSSDGAGSKNRKSKKRPLSRFYDDDGFVEKQYHRASKKGHHKDFVQRMHARNGTLSKACNSLNYYTSPAERQREKSRVIVRPTSKPREILVDTSGIFGFTSEFSEPTTPQIIENGFTIKVRSSFQPPDLK
ncbi:unnamed protein product [Rotaria magnacalcarata]|uniref:Uncharacterized protein n=3 Tax=Rotaria magnacalcarata TaxID=392030 RepID=A0A816SG22_9BILA|nr:unnamed protein product [Rotaria magnacalcarata]